jgi:hypothetical protein
MHCTKRRLEKMNARELLNFKLKNLVPTFVGPDKRMYISDKHHMSTALFEAELQFRDHMLHRASYVTPRE